MSPRESMWEPTTDAVVGSHSVECSRPFDSGRRDTPPQKSKRSPRPLSSGWKSLAWTKPPEALGAVRSHKVSKPQHRSKPKIEVAPPVVIRTVRSADWDGARRVNSTGKHNDLGDHTQNTQKRSCSRSARQPSPVDHKHRHPVSEQSPAVMSLEDRVAPKPNNANHVASDLAADFGKKIITGQGTQSIWKSPQSTSYDPLKASSYPLPDRKCGAVTFDDEDDICTVERALSDTSIMTTSTIDQRANVTNFPEMTDDEAIRHLTSIASMKGKGLAVVKHATGNTGGKSRKTLRFGKEENAIYLCGVRPPYFKRKFMVHDIDRVDAKWCCVLVHMQGRASVRLEVDSISTAAVLKAGLVAAGRTSRLDEAIAPVHDSLHVNEEKDTDEGVTDPEQGLSSVRPGHEPTEIYDPDAAQSVAALLAKEMEDERAATAASLPQAGKESFHAREGSRLLRHSVSHGGEAFDANRRIAALAAQPKHQPEDVSPEHVIKRSASLSSIASSIALPHNSDAAFNRVYKHLASPEYTSPADAIDTSAALRRLRTTTEGRGLMAFKLAHNGKGRARVMVRSRVQRGTIGWAHIMPPFTRKNILMQNILGATRSSRVVTVSFKGRDPASFETARLTEAIILEQGFIALSRSAKNCE